jgi:GNAT superfamily N-acetyltransferase
MDANRAWDLFISGFTDTAFARRVATRFRAGPLDAVRFASDENRPGAPFAEFFVRACDPATALAAVAATAPCAEHYLTVLDDQPGLRAAYERGGYRLYGSETLMVCDLATAHAQVQDPTVTVVRTTAEAAWHNANDPQGSTWIMPDNLADPRMTHYAIVRDGRLLARGRNLRIDATHSYVSRVYTAKAQRGQGLAHALMLRLLADDVACGARWSVLTATGMGARLYARLDYRALGKIHIFKPA